MKKNHLLIALAVVLFAAFAVACSNSNNEQGTETKHDSSATAQADSMAGKDLDLVSFKFFTAYANLPSPFNVVNDLYRFNAPYKSELMNPVSNASKYVKNISKEINFGIYGVDLAYANFYSRNSADVDLYNLVHDFAKDIEIETVVNEYEGRYKDNSDNPDSLVSIVDNIYSDVDAFLRKSERYTVASNIMAGSMVEVCYLSINLLKELTRTSGNASLYEKVHNENVGIYHLISLYEEYPDKDSKTVLAALKAYKADYDSLIKSPEDLSKENLDKLIVKIGKLRNSLTR